jgi:phenylalanyl-tRNA synthetase beta chain
VPSDIYYLKGVTEAVLNLLGTDTYQWETFSDPKLKTAMVLKAGKETIVELGTVGRQELNRFDIRQDVFFADIRWKVVESLLKNKTISFTQLPNQLPVYRDLAMVVARSLPYHSVEAAIKKIRLNKLSSMQLFDVFESEKLGADKKSLAVSFTFLDGEKTLTDKEIDGMMNKIMHTLEQDLNAEIRKGA